MVYICSYCKEKLGKPRTKKGKPATCLECSKKHQKERYLKSKNK